MSVSSFLPSVLWGWALLVEMKETKREQEHYYVVCCKQPTAALYFI